MKQVLVVIMVCTTPCAVCDHLDAVQEATSGGGLTEREVLHAQAFVAHAKGDLWTATQLWASVLLQHPRDLLATYLVFISYKVLAEFGRLRDILASLLPHWEKESVAYPFLLGL